MELNKTTLGLWRSRSGKLYALIASLSATLHNTALSVYAIVPYSSDSDMVSSVERMFCDMSEKQLWPLCADSSATYCFDINSQTVKGSGSNATAADSLLYPNSTAAVAGVSLLASGSGSSNAAVPRKSYSQVSTWDP